MTDKTSKNTEISNSQAGLVGDNAEINGDVNVKGDDINIGAGGDGIFGEDNAISTIIKNINIIWDFSFSS